jgi:hypothetical protein
VVRRLRLPGKPAFASHNEKAKLKKSALER